jgi:hypothetical protein
MFLMKARADYILQFTIYAALIEYLPAPRRVLDMPIPVATGKELSEIVIAEATQLILH